MLRTKQQQQQLTDSWSSTPTFNAVCPPIDNIIESGLSLTIISITVFISTGKKYAERNERKVNDIEK